ncbi:MAG: F0F1 ATP synthase subunit epsilon [Gammaproteobacteria bacterium]|nr:F0F1 ATP synthase subunit epsilon [Gammaproteobacteria bacterium]MBT8443142.1 F0F1 ATP synthase subunit epsilon [Gammaproteobacteria bacterium]
MSTINVEIVSAEGHIYSGVAEMVVAPAREGDVGITPGHAPLMTNLRPGEVRVHTSDEEDELFFYVTGGVLEVQPHLITVLADSAMHGDQLDEQAALDAQAAAEEALKGATAKEDIEHAQMQLVEAAARYRAAQKLKGRRS